MKTKILMFLIMGLSFVFGGYLLNDYFNGSKGMSGNYNLSLNHIDDMNGIYNRIITENAVVEGIKSSSKLISTEITVTQDFMYDDSYFGHEAFKKAQKISFFAKGIFTVDLGAFSKENIDIDWDNKIITVNVPKPSLSYIDFELDKTLYGDVEKGFLRFGDIKMNIDEFTKIQIKAEEQINNRLNSAEIRTDVETMSRAALLDIFEAFISDRTMDGFEVAIHFIDY